jgi:MFS family permease
MTSLSAVGGQRSVAGLVLSVGVGCALHVGKLPVAIPVLRDELALSLLQAGFLLSLVQLAGMLLGLVVGMAADRLGPHRVMPIGLLLLAIGSAWGALSPDVANLMASRVLEGMGFLMAVLPAPGLLRMHLQDASILSRALGWWGTYMPLGTALALLLGTHLIHGVGWRGAWLLLSGVSLVSSLALAMRLPQAASPPAGAARAMLPRLSRTLKAPGPWFVAALFFLYSGQWLAVIGFLPTIYSDAGLPTSAIAVLTALAALINTAGNVAAGRCMARGLKPGAVLTMGFSAMCIGAVVAFAAQGHPVWQYVAVLVFSGVGGLIPGTLFGVAVVIAPGQDTVSTTVGWMQQFSSLGQFVGPPAVAWLVTGVGGWHWTWALTGACSAAGVYLAWQLQREWDTRVGPQTR